MAGRSKTWWGQEFLGALARIMDEGRLKRGRSYSDERRQVRFNRNLGKITAKMRGNINHYFGVYETPYYNVEIKFKAVPPARWRSILKKLGSNADWVTHLILGEVPPTIATAFEGSPVGLLPKTRSEIQSSCSCPDWANPCKPRGGRVLPSCIHAGPRPSSAVRVAGDEALQSSQGGGAVGIRSCAKGRIPRTRSRIWQLHCVIRDFRKSKPVAAKHQYRTLGILAGHTATCRNARRSPDPSGLGAATATRRGLPSILAPPELIHRGHGRNL